MRSQCRPRKDSYALEEGFASESRLLDSADLELDRLLDHGNAVRHELGKQRGLLKGVQRKVLDMATTLGMSNSVLRVIERRQFWDKLLVFGGMLLTLACKSRGIEPAPPSTRTRTPRLTLPRFPLVQYFGSCTFIRAESLDSSVGSPYTDDLEDVANAHAAPSDQLDYYISVFCGRPKRMGGRD